MIAIVKNIVLRMSSKYALKYIVCTIVKNLAFLGNTRMIYAHHLI